MISDIAHLCRRIEERWMRGMHATALRSQFRVSMRASIFFFLTSIPFIAFGVLPDRFAWTASPVLFLYAWTTLLSELRYGRAGFRAAAALILWIVFFLVEMVGVHTGIPFGDYGYTGRLGFPIAGIPLAISAAWYAAIVNSWRIAEWLVRTRVGRNWKIPLTAATLTVAFDVVLEPMASIAQEYWVWNHGTIPLTNYISWFVLSGVAVAILRRLERPGAYDAGAAGVTGTVMYGIQVTLFIVASLTHGCGESVVVALGIIAGVLGAGMYRRSHPQQSTSARA